MAFHVLQQAGGQEQYNIDYVMSIKYNPELIRKRNSDSQSTTWRRKSEKVPPSMKDETGAVSYLPHILNAWKQMFSVERHFPRNKNEFFIKFRRSWRFLDQFSEQLPSSSTRNFGSYTLTFESATCWSLWHSIISVNDVINLETLKLKKILKEKLKEKLKERAPFKSQVSFF